MKDVRSAQLSAFLSSVGDIEGDGPVLADDRADIISDAVLSSQDANGPDRKTPAPWVAIIDANQIQRDLLVGELAKTHPELSAIAFATIGECLGSSADPGVVMLRVRQGTSTQIALEDIEQLRSAFPGVPVMAITRD